MRNIGFDVRRLRNAKHSAVKVSFGVPMNDTENYVVCAQLFIKATNIKDKWFDQDIKSIGSTSQCAIPLCGCQCTIVAGCFAMSTLAGLRVPCG